MIGESSAKKHIVRFTRRKLGISALCAVAAIAIVIGAFRWMNDLNGVATLMFALYIGSKIFMLGILAFVAVLQSSQYGSASSSRRILALMAAMSGLRLATFRRRFTKPHVDSSQSSRAQTPLQ